MARRIKLSLGIGIHNAKQEDYEDLPEGWDEMTEQQQEMFLDDMAMSWSSNYIDLGAWVEEYDEESE